MKTTIENRGLYRHVTRTPENDDESWSNFRELGGSIDHYVEDAERGASRIAKGGPEYDQAADVLKYCRQARPFLENPDQRNALYAGMLLAQSIEHLKANLAWRDPVEKKRQHSEKAKSNNQKQRDEKEWIAENKWQPHIDDQFRRNPKLSWNKIAEMTAEEFGSSSTTIKRHCNDPTKLG